MPESASRAPRLPSLRCGEESLRSFCGEDPKVSSQRIPLENWQDQTIVQESIGHRLKERLSTVRVFAIVGQEVDILFLGRPTDYLEHKIAYRERVPDENKIICSEDERRACLAECSNDRVIGSSGKQIVRFQGGSGRSHRH